METYKVKMTCENCGYRWVAEYPKGEEVPILETCPKCDCLRGRYVWG